MKFNFIATTFRFAEDDVIDELDELFYEFGDTSISTLKTNVSGIVLGFSIKNPVEFIQFLRNKLKDEPWTIRYLLRFIPIEKVVTSNISEIKDASIELSKKIPLNKTVKIFIEKRHSSLKRSEIIDEIGPSLTSKVNLENPDWLILIEIIGKYSGISVIESTNLFSSPIEKRF